MFEKGAWVAARKKKKKKKAKRSSVRNKIKLNLKNLKQVISCSSAVPGFISLYFF